jgi:CHAD domain-containing protein
MVSFALAFHSTLRGLPHIEQLHNFVVSLRRLAHFSKSISCLLLNALVIPVARISPLCLLIRNRYHRSFG